MRDITRVLHSGHPVWPGDTAYRMDFVSRIAEGAAVNVMSLQTTTHLGTHLDAPFHYDDQGARLGAVPLELLIGEAQVVTATGYQAVPAEVLRDAGDLPERVLIFTGQPPRWPVFPEGFSPLTPGLVYALAERGVRLLGTDAPSVDHQDSKDLPVHRACAETGIFILEGLDLSAVPAGRYELVCLPLSLPEADASPVRALLR